MFIEFINHNIYLHCSAAHTHMSSTALLTSIVLAALIGGFCLFKLKR